MLVGRDTARPVAGLNFAPIDKRTSIVRGMTQDMSYPRCTVVSAFVAGLGFGVRDVTNSPTGLHTRRAVCLLVTRSVMVARGNDKKQPMNSPTSAQSTEDSSYCSTREAAELLGISIKTAQSWVEAGMLQAWKTPGGHRRILRTSVDALLRERSGILARPGNRSLAQTIVAVDDDPEMRRLYEMHLGDWHARVRLLTVNNGFEALLLVGQESPRVLIADLNMPGMDGFRMVRALRANPDHAALNIVIVSALSTAEIADQGGLPTDVPIFTKPVAFENLKQRLSGYLP